MKAAPEWAAETHSILRVPVIWRSVVFFCQNAEIGHVFLWSKSESMGGLVFLSVCLESKKSSGMRVEIDYFLCVFWSIIGLKMLMTSTAPDSQSMSRWRAMATQFRPDFVKFEPLFFFIMSSNTSNLTPFFDFLAGTWSG